MPDKLLTAFMSALVDGFCPVRLAVLAVLGLLLIMSGDQGLSTTRRPVAGLLCGYFVMNLALKIGLFSRLTLSHGYRLMVPVFYTALGALLLGAGVLFAGNWLGSYTVNPPVTRRDWLVSLLKTRWSFFVGSTAGSILALGAFCWPPHFSMLALMQDVYLPGMLWSAVGTIILYEIFIVAELLAGYCLGRVLLGDKMRPVLRKNRSLVWMTLAAFYGSLGAGLMVMFIQQLL